VLTEIIDLADQRSSPMVSPVLNRFRRVRRMPIAARLGGPLRHPLVLQGLQRALGTLALKPSRSRVCASNGLLRG
jgi:hypothetical protein